MFEIGEIYNRRADIHGRYKGQQYGGIATPADHPYIFIFTGDSGSEYGYIDDFDPNGTFKYTGEGQEGDMKMSKGNLAIRDHQKNNKEILLFESTSRGYVRLLGTCNYVFHHIEERPDRNGNLREAIVFHLDIVNNRNIDAAHTLTSKIVESPKAMYITKPSKGQSLQKLREIALSSTPTQGSTQEKIRSIQNRSRAIKLYAKKRANGICEGCNELAPFETKSGPYLEVHHLTRLADGGADLPQNVIALCPTCHRKAHYSLDHLEFNSKLMDAVIATEARLNQ
ncbi:HNH endonuclease signature motif containing protein [Psychrobacter sp. Pi2-1]|uniref:HNH endonuclease signature motif containing protein n=1 Tax=Psychrobacter sp. Pi2-1 TaxID=2774131 RepID=UPI001918DC01|nr:HNH endonuclease signature motif containing protein [Psychrobacter sp. Pi2-1]